MVAKRLGNVISALAALSMMSACGEGGGGSSLITGGTGGTPTPSPTSTPTPTPTTAVGCSLRERQDWAFAQLKEWYLFYDTLPASLDPTPYATVPDYIDALTATARAQHKDRFFTYLTSIAEENAFINSGSSAGFGVRLGITPDNRLFISEAFEGAPALAAGIDRGTEIVGIGTTSSNIQTVASIYAASGSQGLTDALGPNTAGTTRFLRVVTGGVTSTVSVTKADYSLTPVSSRYGAKIITDNGQQYGYINLRTFISTAEQPLRDAFLSFRNAGITNIIVDLRYNGGGLVSIGDLMGDLMGRNRTALDIWESMTFRPEKASNNSVHRFTTQPQSIAPTRVAFIGTGGTASASELVINGMVPYLHTSAALIGSNTYGKPVGQIAVDKTACDDRFRIIAFSINNAAGTGNYYDGLAPFMEATCQASDDVSFPLGDAREASTRKALDFLEGKACTAIAGAGDDKSVANTGLSPKAVAAPERQLLIPDRPSPAQRETPGLF